MLFYLPGIHVSAGHEVQIMMKAKEMHLLSQPYGNCTYQTGLFPGQQPNPSHMLYSYSERSCRTVCKQQWFLELCGCYNPHLPIPTELLKQFPDYHSCGVVHDDNITETYEQIACYLLQLTPDQMDCNHCNIACNSFAYSYNVYQTPWPHESYHEIFY
jgi:hypothetical protein